MKRGLSLLGIAFICLLASSPVFSAEIMLPNFGFESGLTDWTVLVCQRSCSVPVYAVEDGLGQTYANAVTSHLGNDPLGGIVYNPQEGSSFLEINTTGSGEDALVVFVYQTFDAQQGDTLSGMAAFDPWVMDDKPIYVAESGSVLVNMDPVFFMNVPEKGSIYDTQWTRWGWEAPCSGTYTLMYALANPLGDDHTSYALFDAASVPIPSALLLFGSGLLGLVGIRRRKQP